MHQDVKQAWILSELLGDINMVPLRYLYSATGASYGQITGHGNHSSENQNGLRSWLWAQSESLAMTYSSIQCHYSSPYALDHSKTSSTDEPPHSHTNHHLSSQRLSYHFVPSSRQKGVRAAILRCKKFRVTHIHRFSQVKLRIDSFTSSLTISRHVSHCLGAPAACDYQAG